jgi:hypothetical protein
VSYFEPETLTLALKAAGFRPENRGFVPGFEGVIRFKVLKTLRVRDCNFAEHCLPWKTLSRVIDSRLQITAHPIGWV